LEDRVERVAPCSLFLLGGGIGGRIPGRESLLFGLSRVWTSLARSRMAASVKIVLAVYGGGGARLIRLSLALYLSTDLESIYKVDNNSREREREREREIDRERDINSFWGTKTSYSPSSVVSLFIFLGDADNIISVANVTYALFMLV
jgi:hypothetical protein